MIQYRVPVRNNTPQLMSYTFQDQDEVDIDLTGYVSATLEIKFQGQAYSTLAANIISPRSLGLVQVSDVIFSELGIWDAQFYIVDGAGQKTFGEPTQFRVVANVEDLTQFQLPVY